MLVNYVIIFVSEMEQSVKFYRDVIGLPLKFETTHWTEFATNGATWALHLSDSSDPVSDNQGPMPAGRCRPGLGVTDLEEFHRRMIENEVICIQEPEESFGARTAQYLDPDGLSISVGEIAQGS
jgi:lactoylglutathione lyase